MPVAMLSQAYFAGTKCWSRSQERTDGASVRRCFFLSGRTSAASSALHTDSSHSMSTETAPAVLRLQLTVSSDASGDAA